MISLKIRVLILGVSMLVIAISLIGLIVPTSSHSKVASGSLIVSVKDPSQEQGTTANYTVTVSSENGYIGSVTLSTQNMPTGVSVNLTPDSVYVSPSHSGNSTMIVDISQTAPVGAYSIVVVGTGAYGVIQSTTFTLEVAGGSTLTFTESGIPSGTSWNATLQNYGTESSTTNTIVFTKVAGGEVYSWSVSSPTKCGSGCQYSASPSSGTLNVFTTDSYVNVTYYPLVVFSEFGLQLGDTWSVTFGNITQQSAMDSISFVEAIGGNYSWNAGGNAVGCSRGCEYAASPSSGTVRVPSRSMSVSVTLQKEYYLTMNCGVGGVCSPSSEWVSAGTDLLIQATPESGYWFNSWSGSGTGSSSCTKSSCSQSGSTFYASISMSGPIIESASFGKWSVDLSMPGWSSTSYSLNATTNYDVGPTPFFIEIYDTTTGNRIAYCGSGSSCSGTDYGSDVNNGSNNYVAYVDEGNGSNVQATSNTIAEDWWTLTVNCDGGGSCEPGVSWYTEGATIQIDAYGLSCGSGCHWEFTNWVGSGYMSYSGTFNAPEITLYSAITETAYFQQQYYLYMTTGGDVCGTGTTSPGSGWFNASSKVTVSASANWPVTFASWDFTVYPYQSTNSKVTITMSSAVSAMANWGCIL
jgi:hypothetical protein